MMCDYCKGTTKPRRVKKRHVYKRRLYIVENVPAEICQDCGERYYHAATLDAIDGFLDHEHPVKETMQVEVVTL